MNRSTAEFESRGKLYPEPGVDSCSAEGEHDPIESVVAEYLERLEQGSSISPEEFADQCELQDPRLLESLRSIRLLQLAAREIDAPLEGETDAALTWSSDSMVGHTLGDYRLIREIGRGGMGLVFEAEQISLGRRVAVKVLPPASMLDERQVARFAVESQAAAQLQHPNIVPIYSVGCRDSIYYFSMPLIDAVPLEVPQSAQEVARIAACVARALHHAHDLGVIHRDVKPSNLMLDRAGKVWVADFGLARCRSASNVTATGAVVGTLRYMSPEQASGVSRLVDHRTDIYALGVTMYELLTGRCPYDSSDRATFLAELERGEPEHPRKLRRDVPVDLETIVLKALARQPEHRYATAGELADDLERFQAGAVILARRPSAVDRLTKWMHRNRRWVAVAAATWMFVSVGAVLAAIKLGAAAKATSEALTESRESLAEADAFYTQARQVIDHFAVTVSPRLAHVPGAADIRREVLRDTLTYYQAFMDQVADNPRRQRELADTQIDVAEIAEQIDAFEQAVRGYQQAARILAQLPDGLADEALCWNNLGGLWAAHGQVQQADQAYANAIACHDKLLAANSRDPETQRRRALTKAARGNLWAHSQEPERALAFLREAQRIQEELRQQAGATDSLSSALRHDLIVTLGSIASVLRPRDTEEALRTSLACVELVADLRETDVAAERDVEESHIAALFDSLAALNNHAALLHDAGQLPEAASAARQAVALGEEICQLRPSIPKYLHELAITENNLARLYGAQDKTDRQCQSFERARRWLTTLVSEFPDNARYRVSLAAACFNVGVLADERGEAAQAVSALTETTEHYTWLQEHSPDYVRQIQDLLNESHERIARLSRP